LTNLAGIAAPRLHGAQRGRRCLQRHSRFEPNHDVQPRGVFAERRARQRGGETNRNQDVGRSADFDPKEIRRRDTDDRQRRPVDHHRRPDGVFARAELVAPQTMTDHGDGPRRPAPIVVGRQQPSAQRLDAKRGEEITTDILPFEDRRLA
jgi:hypothetical protein